jgi:hypothetical protein
LPATDRYAGNRLTTTEGGRRVVTPLFFVFLAIGTTDLLFALDSIPAVFGVTQEPYLVSTANAFALLGLRALYFLLRGLLDRLVFLSTGLSVILAFIGVKLILAFLHELEPSIPHVPTRGLAGRHPRHPGRDDGGQPGRGPPRPQPPGPRRQRPRPPPAPGRRRRARRRSRRRERLVSAPAWY